MCVSVCGGVYVCVCNCNDFSTWILESIFVLCKHEFAGLKIKLPCVCPDVSTLDCVKAHERTQAVVEGSFYRMVIVVITCLLIVVNEL